MQANHKVREDITAEVVRLRTRVSELERTERGYRSIFESARQGILAWDREGRVVVANPAAASILGHDGVEDLLGIEAEKLWPTPGDWQQLQQGWRPSASGGDCVTTLLRRDGSTVDVLAGVTVERGESGEVIRTACVFHNITEWKLAQDALALREEQLRCLFASVPDAILVVDAGGVVTDCNRSAWSLLGGGAVARVRQRPLASMLAETGDDQLARVLEAPEGGDGARRVEVRMVNADGAEFPAEISVGPLRDSRGKRLGHVLVVKDVTERVQMERAFMTGTAVQYVRALADRLGGLERTGSRADEVTAPLPTAPAAPAPDERWLSVDEVAGHLGVQKDTIYKWIVRKSMPAHKFGRLWRFRRTEVDAWLMHMSRPSVVL